MPDIVPSPSPLEAPEAADRIAAELLAGQIDQLLEGTPSKEALRGGTYQDVWMAFPSPDSEPGKPKFSGAVKVARENHEDTTASYTLVPNPEAERVGERYPWLRSGYYFVWKKGEIPQRRWFSAIGSQQDAYDKRDTALHADAAKGFQERLASGQGIVFNPNKETILETRKGAHRIIKKGLLSRLVKIASAVR